MTKRGCLADKTQVLQTLGGAGFDLWQCIGQSRVLGVRVGVSKEIF